MSGLPTYITAHAGARDHYQLALALSEGRMLDSLVTDWYTPDLLYHLLPRSTGNRHVKGLSSRKVINCWPALGYALKMKVSGSFSDNIHKDRLLSVASFKRARDHRADLFLYSYYAWDAFSRVNSGSMDIRKLLFQLHPHPLSIRKLLAEELELVPEARASLMYENEMRYSKEYLQQLGEESLLADAIMVASSYTCATLVENGVNRNNIMINPYGIDASLYRKRSVDPGNRALRVLFVGSMVQRKGLYYLLSAVEKLGTGHVELVLCGRGFIDKDLINGFRNISIEVKLGLSSEDLVTEMHKADVFVLPSLTEGFAHVILEAMSAGLMVITTNNTCGPDIIEEGKEGFLVPIRSVEDISEKLHWCATHRNEVFEMGQLASDRAGKYTWDVFRERVRLFAQAQTRIS